MRDLKIKLGAPNYPGDTMTITGTVTEKRDADRTVKSPSRVSIPWATTSPARCVSLP